MESLEPRRLLDGVPVVAFSPAVDPAAWGGLVQAAPVAEVEAEILAAAVSVEDTFSLHSNPGAAKVIHLDFDGHTTTGTRWNTTYTGGDPIVTPAFSFEGGSEFSDNELARIRNIWQRVAEDFLPFDVDVTTEDPGVEALRKVGGGDSNYGIRVCIGGDSDWYPKSVGGLSYVGSFAYNSDTPSFIFPVQLVNGYEKYVAEATSHEVGHSLDLNHDGTSTVDYYEGHGYGATGWAPIMGIGYYKALTQWSQGEYADADNQTDDLAVLAAGTDGYRADDHGDAIGTAGALAVDGATVSGEGIIERNTDRDYFVLSTGAGAVTLSISPASRGPNLDILATLYDDQGVVVATSNPADALNANFTLSLPAGTYYLSVEGTGKGDPLGTGYTDYGSLGYYSITGTVMLASPPEVTIEATDPAAAEAGLDTARFRVWRTGDTGAPLEVFYSTSGQAVDGGDYEALSGSVVIAAESTFADVVVTPIDDDEYEGDETVVLTLDASASYQIGAGSSAQALIADDDPVPGVDLEGDANLDGVVDAADYVAVRRSLGTAEGAQWSDGDFDGDGDVDFADLTTVRANMGRTQAVASAAPDGANAPSPVDALASASPVAAVAEAIAPAGGSTLRQLAAMADAASRARVDVFAQAGARMGSLLPRWLMAMDDGPDVSEDLPTSVERV